jgi:hypothetical protein
MPVPRGQSATIRVSTAVFQYVAPADDNPWSLDRRGATLPADHGKAAYHFSPAQRLAEASGRGGNRFPDFERLSSIFTNTGIVKRHGSAGRSGSC